ncbi:MAG: glycosyltransferase [Acetobacter sp.]|uniref:glycosyltransferase n=1 Tax=Acetobacter sp. TaxID=440 RepID=UPI0039EC196C
MTNHSVEHSFNSALLSKVHYWREGEKIQNFGDFLSEFFLQYLFLPMHLNVQGIHLIGSVLDDLFVPLTDDQNDPIVFWGCGLRKPDGLSRDRLDRTRILAVRGPLSRAHLRLGAQIPVGDPGFLLPALYQPKLALAFHKRTLCIPHFLDNRDDDNLLAHSGCDLVLRTAIPATIDAMQAFIDAVVAADFVVTASLHGAVVAAAYNKPFAFWDSGEIDVPFKWQDFAASMGIECAFQPDLESSRKWYEAVKSTIHLPEAWRLLLAPPLPLRPEAIVQILHYYSSDLTDYQIPSLFLLADFHRSAEQSTQMADEIVKFIHNANSVYAENTILKTNSEQQQNIIELQRIELTENHHTLSADLEKQHMIIEEQKKALADLQESSSADLEKFQNIIDTQNKELTNLKNTLVTNTEHYHIKQKALLRQVADEKNCTQSVQKELTALQHASHHTQEQTRLQLHDLHVRLTRLSDELGAVYNSTSWRAMGVLRSFATRHPEMARFLRRSAKIIWWAGTGQLRQRLKQRAALLAGTHAMPVEAVAPPLPVCQMPKTAPEPFHLGTPGTRKVVFIDSRYPRIDRDSGSLDTFNMIRILQSFGYEILFIATSEFHEINIYGENLQKNNVIVVTSAHFDSIHSFLKQHGEQISLAILSRVDCGGHFMDDMRRLAPKARVIFNTVDLHHIRMEREAILKNDRMLLNEAYRTEERERYLIRMADCTFVVSSFEEAKCQELVPGADVALMPILRDIPGRQAEFSDRKGIGFIGGFKHQPNLDAVTYFLDNIWPSLRSQNPDITLHVMGADMPQSLKDLKLPGVEMVGFVPELAPWFNRLRLTIAPLRYGAGAKGKVVSSFSFGVPCVMSAIAAEGMGIEGTAKALVADAPVSYVDIITRLYNNKSEWQQISDACLAIVEDQNSISHGRHIFETVLARLNLPAGPLEETA